MTRRLFVLLALALTGCAGLQERHPDLGGTAWRRVEFRSGDGSVLQPDERSKYLIVFGADGILTARFDCNRGRGSWKSDGAGQLEFGLMATTRAYCGTDALHDRVVRLLPQVRSYLVREGRLYLSLVADGGVFEFEPVPPVAMASAPSLRSRP